MYYFNQNNTEDNSIVFKGDNTKSSCSFKMDRQDDLRYDYLLISRADLEIFLGSITKMKPDTLADFLTCYFSADDL